MITFSVLGFLALIATTLVAGAVVSVHVYGVNTAQAGRVARFRRDVAVNDAADAGESL